MTDTTPNQPVSVITTLKKEGQLSSHTCFGRTVLAAYGLQWKTLRQLEQEISQRWQVGDTQPTISARLREVQKRFPLLLEKQTHVKNVNGKSVWFYRVIELPKTKRAA